MVKIGIFALSVSARSLENYKQPETMDRGMICPSFVFDYLRYSPNCAFKYHARGWGCCIRFIRFKGFSRHLSRGWADMKLHPFLVYIGKTAIKVERIGRKYE